MYKCTFVNKICRKIVVLACVQNTVFLTKGHIGYKEQIGRNHKTLLVRKGTDPTHTGCVTRSDAERIDVRNCKGSHTLKNGSRKST